MTTLSDAVARVPFRARAARARNRRSRPTPTRERLDFVEGMRGLAALYVVLGHFASMSDPGLAVGKSASPAWLRPVLAFFGYGHLAVAAFIVISGYCLQFALFRSSEGRLRGGPRFFRRRALRILPAYYACLALSMVVTWAVTSRYAGTRPFDTYLPMDRGAVLSHLFLVHNVSPGWMYKINGVLWSIAVEAQLYLVFPLLVWSLWRFGRRAAVLGTTLVALELMLVVPGAGKLYFWFAPLFALGMASAHLAFRPRPALGIVPKPAMLAAGALTVLTALALGPKVPIAVSDGLFGSAVAALCYLMTVQPGGLGERLLSLRPLVALGMFSYSLYLVHHPVQQVFWLVKPAAFARAGPSFAYLLVVALPVILVFARAFSRVFERPFVGRSSRAAAPERGAVVALPLRVLG